MMSAGPHLNPPGAGHPEHAGDMPPLLATKGGKAEARFITDRFSLAQLRDADGSAAMVHALPDNASPVASVIASASACGDRADDHLIDTSDLDRDRCGASGTPTS